MNKILFDVDRLPDFTTTIPHRNWEVALQELFAAIVCAKPGELVEVVGPSRAGKTLLIETAQGILIDKNSIGAGEQPIVNIIAMNDGHQGSFDSKEFALYMLDAINHPTYSLAANDNDEDLRRARYYKTSESLLKRAFINGIARRKTRYLFIDEVQHVQYATKNARAPEAILNSWKAMAQSVGFVLILVGSYPMIKIIQRSPHLLGRKEQIHFPRYQWTEIESKIFAGVVATYADRIEKKGIQNKLMECVPFLYRATFGCVGILDRLLRIASTRAILRDCAIDAKLIHDVMLSSSDLEIFSKECIAGESLLVKETFNPPDETPQTVPSKEKAKARSGRPFQRKPENMEKGHRATKARGRND